MELFDMDADGKSWDSTWSSMVIRPLAHHHLQ